MPHNLAAASTAVLILAHMRVRPHGSSPLEPTADPSRTLCTCNFFTSCPQLVLCTSLYDLLTFLSFTVFGLAGAPCLQHNLHSRLHLACPVNSATPQPGESQVRSTQALTFSGRVGFMFRVSLPPGNSLSISLPRPHFKQERGSQ